MYKNRPVIPILILCWCVLLVACAPVNKISVSQKKIIKVGASIPLTGSLAYKGIPARQAMELAVQELNQRGGINGQRIEIIFEDNQGLSDKAANGATKLIEVDKVNVLLAQFTNLSSAIAPISQTKNKVLIYQSTVPSIAKQSKYTFRDYYNMDELGGQMAKAAVNENLNQVAVIYLTSEWGKLFFKSFQAQAPSNNINIVYDASVESNTKDFKKELIKSQNEGAQALIYMGLAPDSNLFLKQIGELNLTHLRLFILEGPNPAITGEAISKEIMRKMRAIGNYHYYDPTSSDQQVKTFVANYQKQFGMIPDANAAYFYDDIYVLSQALKACDAQGRVDDTDCLADQLLLTQDYQGVAGPLSFDADGNAEREQRLFELVDDEWVAYKLD